MGFYFSPRGGSAHACRAIAAELERQGFDVSLVAGSRTDLGAHADAERFFAGRDVSAVDFTPALSTGTPLRSAGVPGTAPIHASYEDRPGAEDPVFASLGVHDFESQVAAWTEAMEDAGAGSADLLYLHHLTPLNEVAARSFPNTPVLGHVHGSELLMLERIADGAPAGWAHADRWVERICEWAASCARIVVNSSEGRKRAARRSIWRGSKSGSKPFGIRTKRSGSRSSSRAARLRPSLELTTIRAQLAAHSQIRSTQRSA